MPHGSELMMLPDRAPIVFNLVTDRFETLETNPFQPEQRIYPVGVFNSPGYVNLHFCAYDDFGMETPLPLFSYGALGFGKNNFRSAALQVDDEPRQDLRLMPIDQVQKGVEKYRKKYPDNRLMRHLEKCALEYGCPAGKNFFLGRYEAPLPTSVVCNARCLGCISLQTVITSYSIHYTKLYDQKDPLQRVFLIPFAFFAALFFALLIPLCHDPLFLLLDPPELLCIAGKFNFTGFLPEIKLNRGQCQRDHLAQLVRNNFV